MTLSDSLYNITIYVEHIIKWNTIIFVADIPDWPEADLMELMKRMEKDIPQKDSLRFDSRADKLNWDNVRQCLFLNWLKF